MKVAIGNDHAGLDLKPAIMEYVASKGHEVINLGPDAAAANDDYPIAGERVGRAIADGTADAGILICGTGVGISIAANKVKGVRACVCSEPATARLTRLHNDANIIAFGARIVGIELAKSIVDAFLDTDFSGEERHSRRIQMLHKIEDGGSNL